MRNLAGDAHLGVEALEPSGVRGEVAREKLGDRLAELQIVGPIDLAHAAPAEQPDDPGIERRESRRA